MQTRGVVVLNICLSSKYNEGNLLAEKFRANKVFSNYSRSKVLPPERESEGL